ncbi:uncharacterized protein LOC113648386 [Tachysurus fulvidraco]|uniref:uncharacterized protein LOC113648386 n=1 Tax=Tachysurus fulvidraco TaxID=1234273 RepID=UPI001FEDF05C|nr:uncharacterized protein LOC113648386 [Tachysurus fulvidraco]
MVPLWIIAITLYMMCPARSVDFFRPSFLSVRFGECISLICPFGHNQRTESVIWYKQSVGEMPRKIGERIVYKEVKFSPEFKNSGFIMEMTDKGISLTIPNIKQDHEGLYYCGKLFTLENVTLSNGTFLAVSDDRDVKVSVWQHGVSDSVPAGASVTLQCSVLSESRAAELQVLWFRAAPPQSHPQIIYTHHNSSHQCESDSSTHTCVYNFSKNILSLNDTGTYYCAVLLCGKIIFGNGTSVQMEQSTDPVVIYLAVALGVCVLVIVVHIATCKERNCECFTEKSQECKVTKTENKSRDAGELNYVASLINKKTGKTERAHDNIYTEVIYSSVS